MKRTPMLKTARDCVELFGYDANGELVHAEIVSQYDWWESAQEVIESAKFRRNLGIRVLEGKLFDENGNVESSWRNHYSEEGTLGDSWGWWRDGNYRYDAAGDPRLSPPTTQ